MTTLAKAATALVASVLLTACAATAPAPTAVDGPAKSVTSPVKEDAAFASSVQAAGFDSGTAAFAQLTTSTVQVNNGHTFVVRQAFANSATATSAYHLFTGGGGTPGQAPKLTFTKTDTSLRFSLTYAINAADLPADLRAQVTAGLPNQAPSQADRDGAVAAFVRPMNGGRLPADGAPSTIDVILDGVISQTKEFGIDEALETAELDKTHAGTSWEAFKAGKKVWDAIEANELIADALTRINAARDCAANPTNELVLKQYRENPNAKKELLDKLDDLHDEVTVNALAVFAGLFTDTAGGVLKAAPWLGFITGPAVNYIKETLSTVINDRVLAAEQLVPKCEVFAFEATSVGSEWSAKGKICDITKPFSLSGSMAGSNLTAEMTPTGATAGKAILSGNMGGTKWSSKGTYTVQLDQDGQTGTLLMKVNLTMTSGGNSGIEFAAMFALTRIASCG